MGTSKVSRNFSSSKFTDSALSLKASYIVLKMTDNVSYVTPNPALAAVTTANNNYIAAMNKVVGGSKEDTVIKNDLRVELEQLLKQLSDYVQQTSGGDTAIILSSGFDVNKKPSSIGALDKATGLVVTMGNNKGSVVVSCDVVEYADFYEVNYTKAPATSSSLWISKTGTKRKQTVDGLTSGDQLVFRMAGAGSDPSRVWSDEITTFVV